MQRTVPLLWWRISYLEGRPCERWGYPFHHNQPLDYLPVLASPKSYIKINQEHPKTNQITPSVHQEREKPLALDGKDEAEDCVRCWIGIKSRHVKKRKRLHAGTKYHKETTDGQLIIGVVAYASKRNQGRIIIKANSTRIVKLFKCQWGEEKRSPEEETTMTVRFWHVDKVCIRAKHHQTMALNTVPMRT